MMPNDKKQSDVDLIPLDRTGKVFAIIGNGMRLCLICEGVFARQSAREHARVPCRLAVTEVADYSSQYPICVSFTPVAPDDLFTNEK